MNSNLSTAKCFDRLHRAASQFQPKNEFELLIGYIHAAILELGFVCVTQQASDVPGFSPSIRELPAFKFLPKDWLTDPSSATVSYKHKKKPENIYATVYVLMDTQVLFSVLMHGGDAHNLEINLRDYIRVDAHQIVALGDRYEEMFQNTETLNQRIVSLFQQIIPELFAAPESSSYPGPSGLPPSFQPATMIPPNVFQPSPASNPFSVGRSDLDPFGSDINIPRVGHPPPPALGGGNLVGPDHPMFHPGSQTFPPDTNNPFFPQQPYQPGYPHYGMPRPRFDPTGPIFGPNNDFDPTFDPRFPRGAPRPGPRGPGPNRNFFGEPDPDHFKPPGW